LQSLHGFSAFCPGNDQIFCGETRCVLSLPQKRLKKVLRSRMSFCLSLFLPRIRSNTQGTTPCFCLSGLWSLEYSKTHVLYPYGFLFLLSLSRQIIKMHTLSANDQNIHSTNGCGSSLCLGDNLKETSIRTCFWPLCPWNIRNTTQPQLWVLFLPAANNQNGDC
jgi:hypothetical protein